MVNQTLCVRTWPPSLGKEAKKWIEARGNHAPKSWNLAVTSTIVSSAYRWLKYMLTIVNHRIQAPWDYMFFGASPYNSYLWPLTSCSMLKANLKLSQDDLKDKSTSGVSRKQRSVSCLRRWWSTTCQLQNRNTHEPIYIIYILNTSLTVAASRVKLTFGPAPTVITQTMLQQIIPSLIGWVAQRFARPY